MWFNDGEKSLTFLHHRSVFLEFSLLIVSSVVIFGISPCSGRDLYFIF